MFNQNSGKGQPTGIIPKGTLCWINLKVESLRKSQKTGGEYYSVLATVVEGPYKGRNIFDKIAVPTDPKNSEAWREFAVRDISRICEATGFFKHDDPSSYTKLESFVDKGGAEARNAIGGTIDGASRIGVKVNTEKDDKGELRNRIAEYLSPNPNGHSFKDFEKLTNGQDQTGAAKSAASDSGGASAGATKDKPSWLDTPGNIADEAAESGSVTH